MVRAVLTGRLTGSLVSRPSWKNTSFNASHLVRPAQLHHRYCLSRDCDHWFRKTFILLRCTCHLEQPAYRVQKSSCGIRNIVLKDILRHSCLIAVTRPSDRYLTSASAAFCRHTWRFINVLIIRLWSCLYIFLCIFRARKVNKAATNWTVFRRKLIEWRYV